MNFSLSLLFPTFCAELFLSFIHPGKAHNSESIFPSAKSLPSLRQCEREGHLNVRPNADSAACV